MSAGLEEKSFRIDELPPYVLGNIGEAVLQARLRGVDVIDLSQINPSMAPLPAAVDRLVQTVLLPHNHRYSSSQGITRLREAISDWYQRRYSVSSNPATEVVVTMGIKEGLAHLLFAVICSGDNILIPTPSYPVHVAAAFIAGGCVIGVPLCAADEEARELNERSDYFFERLADTLKKTWPRPKVIIVNFPHNPTGLVVTLGFFERLLQVARKHSLFIFHDFSYAELCYEGYRAPSILQVSGAKELAVEFCSLSKSHGLAGWRVGYCVGNERLLQALKKIKSYLDFGIFQPMQIAAIEALCGHEEHVREIVSNYEQRRDVLVSGLVEIGWPVRKPYGGLFVWAKIPKKYRELGSIMFAEKLLAEAQVAVCPGEGFSVPDGDSFVRFALMENEARLRRAVANIAKHFEF